MFCSSIFYYFIYNNINETKYLNKENGSLYSQNYNK